MDQDTVSKVADATAEVAKTTDTALKLAGRFGSSFKGALDTTGKMLEREIQFIAARRALKLSDKWEALMNARGLPTPTRALPPNFVIPLLTSAVLEEDDEAQALCDQDHRGFAQSNLALIHIPVQIVLGDADDTAHRRQTPPTTQNSSKAQN
jgi:hypothetical protein